MSDNFQAHNYHTLDVGYLYSLTLLLVLMCNCKLQWSRRLSVNPCILSVSAAFCCQLSR